MAAGKRKRRATRRSRKTRKPRKGLWLAVMVAVAALLIWGVVEVSREVSRRSAEEGFQLPWPGGGSPPEITNSERQHLDDVFEAIDRAKDP